MNRRLNHIFMALIVGWLFIPVLGAGTFFIKIGSLDPKATLTYFIGNAELFINPKSLSNTLSLQLPHILAYAIVLFGVFHFWNMLVTDTSRLKPILLIAVTITILNWGAGFLVILWGDPWHYVKYAGVWATVVGLLCLQVLLLRQALESPTKST